MCVIVHEPATLNETASCSRTSCNLKLPLFQAMTVRSAYNILYPGRAEGQSFFWRVIYLWTNHHHQESKIKKKKAKKSFKNCKPIQRFTFGNIPLRTIYRLPTGLQLSSMQKMWFDLNSAFASKHSQSKKQLN